MPDDIRRTRPDHAVEPETVLGALDLAGVGRRDRVDHLREHGPALQVAQRAVVLEPIRRAEVPGQAERAERVHAELALVADVVDREDTRHATKRRIVPVEHLQEDGDEARLPVVGVEDARPLAAAAEVLECRARKEGEAQAVVALAVEARPVEEGRVVDEDDLDASVGLQAGVPGGAREPVERDQHRAGQLRRGGCARAVARKQHRHAVTEPHEGFRQGRGDVGKTAALDEGAHLRRDERDVQGVGQCATPRTNASG